MGKLKKVLTLLSLLSLVLAMTACRDSHAYGIIKKINKSKITIEAGSYTQSKDSSAAGSDKSDSSETTGSQDSAGSFTSNGSILEYELSSAVDPAELSSGDLVKLTLDGNLVTAIELVKQTESTQETDASRETENSKQSAVFTVNHKSMDSVDQDYDTSISNLNTVLVENSGSLKLKDSTLTKSGNTTNDEKSRSYGLNAVLAVSGGSTASVDRTTVTSSGTGASGIFATGKNTKITASNIKLYTTGEYSRGFNATYGGKLTASDSNITTKGAHSAPILADQGQGYIHVSDTAVSAEGVDSPCIYSAGRVYASGVTGNTSKSQIASIEGPNRIILEDCILQGAGDCGIGFSSKTAASVSDKKVKKSARFQATNSKLTTTSSGPMFWTSGIKARAELKDSTLYYSSGILADITGNRKNGRTAGGTFTLKGINQVLQGDISCDASSSASLYLTQKSIFTGAINKQNTASASTVSLDATSSWEMTADSYLTQFINEDCEMGNIRSNGYTLYYDHNNEKNKWLKGETYRLPGGGKLTPAS